VVTFLFLIAGAIPTLIGGQKTLSLSHAFIALAVAAANLVVIVLPALQTLLRSRGKLANGSSLK